MAFCFIFAAVLHPQEFWCLPNGIIYYITIPSMYLFLMIYSVFNLNVVSWGTREAIQSYRVTPGSPQGSHLLAVNFIQVS